MTPRSILLAACCGLVCVVEGRAQTHRELMLVRDQPSKWASVIQVRAGFRGGAPESKDEAVGLERDTAFDGHFYWRAHQMGERTDLKFYAGRDGTYLGLADSDVLGSRTVSRLEFSTRYFPFWREGFYRGDSFVPTGRYEGAEHEVRLGFGQDAGDGLEIELGPFFRRHQFEASEQTASGYVVPGDFNAYGVRVVAEHNTMQLANANGRPEQGFVFTVVVEREQNDSDTSFGVPGVWEGELPSGLWRGEGRLQWVIPNSQWTFWEVDLDGRLTDRDDRIVNYNAYQPPGHMVFDGRLGLRMDLGPVWVTPYAKGQFLKVVQENGLGSDQKIFFGGGIDAGWDFGDMFTVVAEYSYLNNEYREPIGTDRDLYGEHMFFLGAEIRFGGQRR